MKISDVALVCLRCEREFPGTTGITSQGCPVCASEAPSNFRAQYAQQWDITERKAHGIPSLWRYRSMLPIAAECQETLGEGLTPLTPLLRLGSDYGLPALFLKDESRNPTGSHKDRFSAVFISYARQRGYGTVATASSGNAGASLAAYASRANLKCVVATSAGGPQAMAAQIEAFGATIMPFEDKQDRWRFLEEGANHHGWLVASPFRAPVVGSHPIGISGYKTLAYEIVEQMGGRCPDWCALPVCYGDALIGMWQGFKDLKNLGIIQKLPRLVAAEAYGSLSQTIVDRSDRLASMPRDFDTVAVSIGAAQSTFQALTALRESNGHACSLTNEELLGVQSRLARNEGVFGELSAVAPLAAISKLLEGGTIARHETVVAISTSSGLKDLDISGRSSRPTAIFSSPQAAWTALNGAAT